ncbi:hypothetical protein E1285_43045 [Actinomadura sp. 7K507]|nr:hypothetical protein E1285_43045 [Actinomadura sp. 7K507]
MLTVPSYLLLRRAWYRTVYRVTNRWSPRLLLAAVGVTAAIVAGAFLITIVLDEVLGVRVPAALLFVPGGLLVMRYYMEMRTALQINALGVKLGGVPTPWASVDRLVLSGDAAAVTVEVRRRADAPAQDPGPVPVTIPAHKMPPADLVTAIRRFGPAAVQVIRRQGTTEQRLSP